MTTDTDQIVHVSLSIRVNDPAALAAWVQRMDIPEFSDPDDEIPSVLLDAIMLWLNNKDAPEGIDVFGGGAARSYRGLPYEQSACPFRPHDMHYIAKTDSSCMLCGWFPPVPNNAVSPF